MASGKLTISANPLNYAIKQTPKSSAFFQPVSGTLRKPGQ